MNMLGDHNTFYWTIVSAPWLRFDKKKNFKEQNRTLLNVQSLKYMLRHKMTEPFVPNVVFLSKHKL